MLILGGFVGLAGCGGGARQAHVSHVTTPSHAPAPHPPALPPRFFSANSFWNQPLPANAPIDPNSALMVSSLTAEVHREQVARSGPWINTAHDGVPIITVSADQPTVQVILRRPDGATDPALSAAWRAVPLPAAAQPSTGDEDLVVWQPATDRMWEFFGMTHRDGAWAARWGGAMQNVSTDPGVYGPAAWPGAKAYWGVTATSLPLVGGAITLQQLRAGHIDHVLALAIPRPRARAFAVPAERTDGSSPRPDALPEGARLRLDPTLGIASLDLPPVTRAIAEAAQRYGIIIRDTSGEVTFYAQYVQSRGGPPAVQPYYGPHGLFDGREPSQLLASFPWSALQVIKLDLHTHSA